MRILVTGAAGFLGLAVVERLLAHGERDIRCFVRPARDLSGLENVRSHYPGCSLNYMAGNLAVPDDARRAVEGIDCIYHLAAGMRGLPATVFLNTVVASKCLLEAIADKKRRVVLVSSVGVYGTSSVPADRVISESAELDPHPEKRNVYFHAKIWQEHLFREQAERGRADLVILRPGVLYGDGDPSRALPPRIGLSIGRLLFVFGGKQLLPLSHVVNCAEAIVIAGQSAEASGHCYNVIDDDLPTANQYLRQYKRQVKHIDSIRFSFPTALVLSRIVEKWHMKTGGQIPRVLTPYETKAMWKGHRFDNQSIKKLGWKQVMPTADGMRQTFSYLRSNQNGTQPVKQTNLD